MNTTHDPAIDGDQTTSREDTFASRQAVLAAFRAALCGHDDSRPVHVVHGPGGIGKSALLRRFATAARAAGRDVVELDCRTVAHTPGSFLAAAREAFGRPEAVLLIDNFDQCRRWEGWFWDQFLPRLPVGAVAAIAGRLAPDQRWTLDSGWTGLLHVWPLKHLHPEASVALLPRLIGEAPSPRHREALEICAHPRVTREPMLRALMGEDAPELFDWLRRQPYISHSSEGLFPDESARTALNADSRSRDPNGFAARHGRIREYLLAQLRATPEAGTSRAAGDLLYLYRPNQTMAGSGWDHDRYLEELPCGPAHHEDVLRLARGAEDERSAAIAAYWLRRRPAAFRVYRSTRTGRIVAFSAWLRLAHDGADQPEGADVDPVVAAAWRHTRSTAPLRSGETLGVARFEVAERRDGRYRESAALMQWRRIGEMLRDEQLARSYRVLRDDGRWDGRTATAGMVPAEERPTVGGGRYALFGHDWRARSVPEWLRDKSRAMLSGSAVGVMPVPPRADFAVLSRLDFDAAVRAALRGLRKPRALVGSPLQRARVVAESGRDLATVLLAAAEAVGRERGGDKRYRALVTMFVKGAPTQKAAAIRLGLPLSTYRRHLSSGVEALCEHLWRREMQGDFPGAPDGETGHAA